MSKVNHIGLVQERRLIIYAIGAAVLISLALGLLRTHLLRTHKANQQQYAEQRVLALWSEHYQSALFFHSNLANFILEELLADKEVVVQLAALSLAQGDQKTIERTKLQAICEPFYERMKKRGLKQLHFHSPESISLLEDASA